MEARRRLPGIVFDALAPPAPETLPRMDIALFVGFAERGPVHRPVRLAEAAEFGRVFGGDVALARDAEGRTATAALGPAVRAFFSNGGQECWAVRVARTAALEARWRGIGEAEAAGRPGVASSGRFRLPGLAALQRDGTLAAALARAGSIGSWPDRMTLRVRAERRAVPATGLSGSGKTFEFTTPLPPALGDLLEMAASDTLAYAAVSKVAGSRVEAVWLGAFTAGADGESWSKAPAPALVPGARLERVTMGIRAELAGGPNVLISSIGLTPEARDGWWSRLSDDERDGKEAFAPNLVVAEPGEPSLAWLPLGLGQRFSHPVGALGESRHALERDGLSRFDQELFLDPELSGVSAHRLREEAERILHIDGRALFGIHAALATGGGAYNPVTLLAAPDASQAGWEARAGISLPPIANAVAAPPPEWFDHRGPCAQKATDRAAGPDRSRFLDCNVQALPAPRFLPMRAERAPGPALLAWTGGPPRATYRLETAGRSDFKGAQLIYEGPAEEYLADARAEGFYYYRLTAQLGEDFSAPAVVGFAVHETGWAALDAMAYDRRPLLAVQRGLIRLAAAAGDMFALLSMPRHYRAGESASHAAELTALRDGRPDEALQPMESRALSFAALHHPWIAGRRGGEPLLETPPDGAVAGIHARRTLARGAWIAAANESVRDVVALVPPLADRDLETLSAARINFIAKQAGSFRLGDALTLSTEPDWGQVNVRRLMSLLRRAAIRRGASYVFEPNGDVLRRAVERGFTHLLDHMLRLGAFAGRTAEDSFRLAVQPSSGDREGGRLIAEIAVAPSQPMRFLTVRLAQTGERFTIAEER
jgi:hypothetical protein